MRSGERGTEHRLPVGTDEILKELHAHGGEFYRALSFFARAHDMQDVEKRLAETWFRGGGSHYVLLRTMGDFLDNSPERLLAFHRRCQPSRDVPHYEDMFVALLAAVVSATVTVAGTVLVDGVKKRLARRRAADIVRLVDLAVAGRDHALLISEQLDALDLPIRRVLAGLLLRERLWRQEIARGEHDRLLSVVLEEGVPASLMADVIVRFRLAADAQGRILPGIIGELMEAVARAGQVSETGGGHGSDPAEGTRL